MVYTSGCNVGIARGDTGDLTFTLTYDDGTPYELDGGTIKLTVAPELHGTPVIEKTVSTISSDGTAVFALTASDTDIPCGAYQYTVKVIAPGGSAVDTVIGYPKAAMFTIG